MMAISAIEKNQALLIEEIEEKHKEVERKAEELLDELRLEVDELQRRQNELQCLEDTKEPLHLLQVRAVIHLSGTRTNQITEQKPPLFIRLLQICKVTSSS